MRSMLRRNIYLEICGREISVKFGKLINKWRAQLLKSSTKSTNTEGEPVLRYIH